MHTIEIPEANIKKYIPSHLGECSKQEYIDMCELIFKMICGLITYEDLKVHAVYKFMNMKPAEEIEFNDAKRNANISKKFSNIHLLSNLMDGFFEPNQQGQKVIYQDYIHNPIKSFKPLWINYYGPTDQFSNIKFGEYLDALRLFFQFEASGDIELLYHIAAILYRPKKKFHFFKKLLPNYDGDIRVKYNPNHVEKRAKAFKYAPYGFIYGVYLLLASFQKVISTAEIPWSGRTLDLSILFQNDSEDNIDVGKDDIGMDAIMFSMAESGVFGTLKELNETPIMFILVKMYDTRRTDLIHKKIRENAENNKPS